LSRVSAISVEMSGSRVARRWAAAVALQALGEVVELAGDELGSSVATHSSMCRLIAVSRATRRSARSAAVGLRGGFRRWVRRRVEGRRVGFADGARALVHVGEHRQVVEFGSGEAGVALDQRIGLAHEAVGVFVVEGISNSVGVGAHSPLRWARSWAPRAWPCCL
jgi:hypothetical protein